MSSKICKTRITPTAWGTATIKRYICGGGGGGTSLTKSTIKASWIYDLHVDTLFIWHTLSFLYWTVALSRVVPDNENKSKKFGQYVCM